MPDSNKRNNLLVTITENLNIKCLFFSFDTTVKNLVETIDIWWEKLFKEILIEYRGFYILHKCTELCVWGIPHNYRHNNVYIYAHSFFWVKGPYFSLNSERNPKKLRMIALRHRANLPLFVNSLSSIPY